MHPGREVLAALIEAAAEITPVERLDLGAVVEGRDEHLVLRLQSQVVNSLPDGVARPGVEGDARLAEGVGQPLIGTAEPDVRRERGPCTQARPQ